MRSIALEHNRKHKKLAHRQTMQNVVEAVTTSFEVSQSLKKQRHTIGLIGILETKNCQTIWVKKSCASKCSRTQRQIEINTEGDAMNEAKCQNMICTLS